MSQMPMLFKKSLTKMQKVEHPKKSTKQKNLPVLQPKVCWLLDSTKCISKG
jgi:hypothetical protein